MTRAAAKSTLPATSAIMTTQADSFPPLLSNTPGQNPGWASPGRTGSGPQKKQKLHHHHLPKNNNVTNPLHHEDRTPSAKQSNEYSTKYDCSDDYSNGTKNNEEHPQNTSDIVALSPSLLSASPYSSPPWLPSTEHQSIRLLNKNDESKAAASWDQPSLSPESNNTDSLAQILSSSSISSTPSSSSVLQSQQPPAVTYVRYTLHIPPGGIGIDVSFFFGTAIITTIYSSCCVIDKVSVGDIIESIDGTYIKSLADLLVNTDKSRQLVICRALLATGEGEGGGGELSTAELTTMNQSCCVITPSHQPFLSEEEAYVITPPHQPILSEEEAYETKRAEMKKKHQPILSEEEAYEIKRAEVKKKHQPILSEEEAYEIKRAEVKKKEEAAALRLKKKKEAAALRLKKKAFADLAAAKQCQEEAFADLAAAKQRALSQQAVHDDDTTDNNAILSDEGSPRPTPVRKHVYYDYGSAIIPTDMLGKKTRGAGPFPEKLMRMLDRETANKSDVIAWCPQGRAFIVRKPKVFTAEVMINYFKQSKFDSFQRQLNLYGFHRITRGVDAGAYYHELFLRGRPDLTIIMARQKGTGHKLPMDASTEPNFYSMKPVKQVGDEVDSMVLLARNAMKAAADVDAAISKKQRDKQKAIFGVHTRDKLFIETAAQMKLNMVTIISSGSGNSNCTEETSALVAECFKNNVSGEDFAEMLMESRRHIHNI